MKIKYNFISAVLLPGAIDHTVTLLGQPAEYWTNYAQYNEAALVTLLGYGPIIFIIGTMFYLATLAILLFKLPNKYSLPLGFLVFVGHAWGGASWIPGLLYTYDIPVNPWLATLIYFLILSILLAHGTKKWFRV